VKILLAKAKASEDGLGLRLQLEPAQFIKPGLGVVVLACLIRLRVGVVDIAAVP
jgi:hypothetical protein